MGGRKLCNYTVPYQYTIKEFELLVDQAVKLNMVLDVHTNLDEMDRLLRSFLGQPSSFLISEIAPTFFVGSTRSRSIRTAISTHLARAMSAWACWNMLCKPSARIVCYSDLISLINDPSTVIARIESSFLNRGPEGSCFLTQSRETAANGSSVAASECGCC